jgi:putative toxin-antitoxin system antitoxin component (TIGR02293 family)
MAQEVPYCHHIVASGMSMARSRSSTAPATLLDSVEEGSLPVAPVQRARPQALLALAERGYTQDEIHELVVPKRTLARRRMKGEALSVEETDKALRLDRIAALAGRVFGDRGRAWHWLRQAKASLDGAAPIAFLGSEAGARRIEDMLLRIDHGIPA